MQRPRRTSEFHEEPGTATKRQSRLAPYRATTSVGLTPVPAGPKYSTRQTTSVTGSATRGRLFPTPQKTPLGSGEQRRPLFSAEKKRNAAGVVLHNDKKWIQDQMVRITDYLKNAFYPGAMANLTEDFFSRPNCLKQMSIKQFVGIINYFLQLIVGNRFTVGTNYVEDIVSILQKINYPYPVNKSWLKTPTTAHSFGNVIVLFDFFMDFVQNAVDVEDFEFELEDSKSDDNCPDLEFKKILLENCQKSFQLWDKQLVDEFDKIKRKTADVLIQKRHGLAGVDVIEAEIVSLSVAYSKLQDEKPQIDPADENLCLQLRKQVKAARAELKELKQHEDELQNQFDEISQKNTKMCKEIAQLETKIGGIQLVLKSQKFSVEGRNECVEKIKGLHWELTSKKQALKDLTERYQNMKTELSDTQKNLANQVDSVNCGLRDVINILDIADENQQFQISKEADTAKIQRLGPLLQQLRCKMKAKIQKAKEQLQNYEEEIKENHMLKFSKLEPEFHVKAVALEKAKKSLGALEAYMMEESKILFTKSQELENQIKTCEIENEELKIQLEKKCQELKELENRNEETLSKAEEKHKIAAAVRNQRLEAWKTDLEECFCELDHLNELLSKNNADGEGEQ